MKCYTHLSSLAFGSSSWLLSVGLYVSSQASKENRHASKEVHLSPSAFSPALLTPFTDPARPLLRWDHPTEHPYVCVLLSRPYSPLQHGLFRLKTISCHLHAFGVIPVGQIRLSDDTLLDLTFIDFALDCTESNSQICWTLSHCWASLLKWSGVSYTR